MKTSEVIYQGQIRTEAVHLLSKNRIVTDGPLDNHGKGEAFSPTDLLATSLACCMLSIMGIVAERDGITVAGTRAEVTKIMGSNPRRVIEIIVEVSFPSVAYTDKEKHLLEQSALTCPVAKSLHPDIRQTISFNYL
ncbi:MAG: OsmC family protein [Bacteroidia bacterium]